MGFKLVYKSVMALLLMLVSLSSWANKTPGDVYQVTEQIVLEVQHLRNELGTKGTPQLPAVQVYKTPLHVFAKSLEVLEKIAKYQQSSNLNVVSVENIPLKEITQADVYQQAEIILEQLHAIQTEKNMSSSDIKASLVAGKTPSNVYENLWKVSFMLDALVMPITPTDVYNNVLRGSAEIYALAKILNIKASTKLPKTHLRTKSSQVLLQGYLNLHKIAALEKKLGLKPFRVPTFPKGQITSSDVYDSTNVLLAEVSRIKIHLNHKSYAPTLKKAVKKTPSDVLAAMLRVEKNINAISNNQ